MTTNTTPALIVELELWSPPGSESLAKEGKDVAARCQQESGLPTDVVLGLNFVPDEQDVETLRARLEAGEVHANDFLSFCAQRGLPTSPEHARSAAEYLVYIQGQPLAWLHVPAERSGFLMAQTLVKWARQNGLELRDGGYTNELLSEAQVYANWQGAA